MRKSDDSTTKLNSTSFFACILSIVGKSIPVHCVVMNTTTPCYLSDVAMISSTGGGGVGVGGGAGAGGGVGVEGGAKAVDEVDVDSYAIIPASTLFTQIVPVVLRKLGYSDDVIFNATGNFYPPFISFFSSCPS